MSNRIKLTNDIHRFKPIIQKVPLNESVKVNGQEVRGLMILEGIIQRYDIVNGNGRRYPHGLFERVLGDKDFKEALESRSMLGHLEHPEDGQTLLSRIPSHVMLEVKDQGDGSIFGRLLVLDTSTGKDLAAIVEAGCTVGISSRGEGEVQRKGDIEEVIAESYVLSTWDIVHNNSVPGAKLRRVSENSSKKENLERAVLESSHEEETVHVVHRSNGSYGIKIDNKVIGNYGTFADAAKVAEKNGYNVAPDPIEESQTPSKQESEFEEYLSTRHKKESQTIMSKITEMRSLGLEVAGLPSRKDIRKYDFNTKVALSERITSLMGRVRKVMKEDVETEPQGTKLLKKLSEYEEEFDVPAEEPAAGEGSEEVPPEEPSISEEDFQSVVSQIFTQYCPDCPEDRMREHISGLYNSYVEDGAFDFQAAIAQAQEELEQEGGEEVEGEEEFLDIGDEELRESARKIIRHMAKELRTIRESKPGKLYRQLKEAQKKLSESPDSDKAKEMRELLKEASAELGKLDEYKTLLKEASQELERTKDYDAVQKKLRENVTLLKEASGYITQLSEAVEEAVGLLDKNKIKHDIDVKALLEDDAEVAAAERVAAEKKKKAAETEASEASKREREARRKKVSEGKEKTPKKENLENEKTLHESASLILRHRNSRKTGKGLLSESK